jgi:hypothetical protein
MAAVAWPGGLMHLLCGRAWSRFLTNKSAPVQRNKKWLSGDIQHDTCSV